MGFEFGDFIFFVSEGFNSADVAKGLVGDGRHLGFLRRDTDRDLFHLGGVLCREANNWENAGEGSPGQDRRQEEQNDERGHDKAARPHKHGNVGGQAVLNDSGVGVEPRHYKNNQNLSKVLQMSPVRLFSKNSTSLDIIVA